MLGICEHQRDLYHSGMFAGSSCETSAADTRTAGIGVSRCGVSITVTVCGYGAQTIAVGVWGVTSGARAAVGGRVKFGSASSTVTAGPLVSTGANTAGGNGSRHSRSLTVAIVGDGTCDRGAGGIVLIPGSTSPAVSTSVEAAGTCGTGSTGPLVAAGAHTA